MQQSGYYGSGLADGKGEKKREGRRCVGLNALENFSKRKGTKRLYGSG